MKALEAWHEFIRTRDAQALRAILHDDVVFESPVVHTPQRGAEITFKYLAAAAMTLGGPRFGYVGEWRNDNGAVLEFVTEVDGVVINGVDIITLSQDGAQIIHFKVMARPLKGIEKLRALMAQALGYGEAPQKPPAGI